MDMYKRLLVVLGITFGFMSFMIGGIKIVHYTESSEFCSKCHSMKNQYEHFTHSKHRTLKCIDCHLPNDNIVNHFLWKSIDGTKDVISQFLGLKEEYDIKLSAHGHKVLQKNCIRCHTDMVWRIDKKRSCIDCHKDISHKQPTVLCSFNTEVNHEK